MESKLEGKLNQTALRVKLQRKQKHICAVFRKHVLASRNWSPIIITD